MSSSPPRQSSPNDKMKSPRRRSTPNDKMKSPRRQSTPSHKMKSPRRSTPNNNMKNTRYSTPNNNMKNTNRQPTPNKKIKMSTQRPLTEKQKIYLGFKWFSFKAPKRNSDLQTVQNWIKKHGLSKKIPVGKRAPEDIVDDIRKYVVLNQLPEVLITSTLSFLETKKRLNCCLVSKFLNKCVFETNKIPRNIMYTFSGSITPGKFIFIFCFF